MPGAMIRQVTYTDGIWWKTRKLSYFNRAPRAMTQYLSRHPPAFH